MLEWQICFDEKLQVTSCCEQLGEMRALACEQMLGLPYDQLLPKLVYKDQDALGWVLQTGEEIRLEEVPLGDRFLPAMNVADLELSPLQKEGVCTGVRVVMRPGKDPAASPGTSLLRRSEELEKLTVMLSHGVRNPLNAIKGAVSYLQSRYAHEPELGEFTGIMSEEIARLERFIGGFLATSCFDQSAVPLDINALLKKISVYNSLQARVAGVELVLDCGPVKPLLVNPFQVEQAILNLLNNAIAVLPPGGQIRLVSRLVQRQGSDFVVVKVIDNGPGMAPAKIAALNDPASGPERGRERGFGLYITREVIQAYDGFMEIDSEAGTGTEVRLVLPVAAESDSA